MCLYPTLRPNKKFSKTKKNGGVIPAVSDERARMVPTGCGQCVECRKQKAREWQVRLQEDIRTNKNGIFITLTFSDESIQSLSQDKYCIGLKGYDLDNGIATRAIRLFMERWRKKFKKSLRHWLVTEIGHNGTENIHMHGIIWTDETLKTIKDIWQYGYIWPREDRQIKANYVNEKTVNYITKYISKMDFKNKTYKSKILTSAGIGRNYINRGESEKNKYKEEGITDETYKTRTGHKIAMPVYWRNKIYSDDEREKLWMKKLDEKIRYVNGEKIDISENETIYYEALKIAQERNKRLGYGDGQKDWTVQKYEKERRTMLQNERKKKAKSHKGIPSTPLLVNNKEGLQPAIDLAGAVFREEMSEKWK